VAVAVAVADAVAVPVALVARPPARQIPMQRRPTHATARPVEPSVVPLPAACPLLLSRPPSRGSTTRIRN
jgi:hypothetical protein